MPRKREDGKNARTVASISTRKKIMIELTY